MINLDIVSKKTPRAAEQNRDDVKAQRDEWRLAQPSMDASKHVFLDESGATLERQDCMG
jgi:hypothetical protein